MDDGFLQTIEKQFVEQSTILSFLFFSFSFLWKWLNIVLINKFWIYIISLIPYFGNFFKYFHLVIQEIFLTQTAILVFELLYFLLPGLTTFWIKITTTIFTTKRLQRTKNKIYKFKYRLKNNILLTLWGRAFALKPSVLLSYQNK